MAADEDGFNRFVGNEPPGHTDHFVEVRDGVQYFQGSTTRVLWPRYVLAPNGIFVPSNGSSPTTKYFGLYVTAGEYSDFFGTKWTHRQARSTVVEVSAQWPREKLVRTISRIRGCLGNPEDESLLLDQYCTFLGEDRATKLRNVMRISQPKRAFLARHIIAQSFNHIMRVRPDKRETQLSLDANIGILIGHLVAESFGGSVPSGEIRVGTDEFDELALQLLANQFFHNREDTLLSLSRTRRLWKSNAKRAKDQLKGLSPEDILVRTLGTPVDVQIACGLSVVGSVAANAGESFKPKINHPTWGVELARFLDRVSLPIDIPPHELMPIKSEWDMAEFVERPFIRIGHSEVVPVDVGLVEERISNGLYEEVKSLKSQLSIFGDLDRAWGHVIEDYVAERLTSPLEEVGVRVLTESEFSTAYRGVRTKLPDLILDFGRDVLVLEVMKGGIRASTALMQDLIQFQEDLNRCLFKKVRQLASVTKTLLANPIALFPDGNPRRLIPIVVSGDKFAHSFVVRAYVEHLNHKEKLFDQSGCDLPVVIDLREVEFLEALVEQGVGVDQLLREWKESDYRDVSLKNFIFAKFSEGEVQYRSTRLRAEFDASIQEIFRLFEWE